MNVPFVDVFRPHQYKRKFLFFLSKRYNGHSYVSIPTAFYDLAYVHKKTLKTFTNTNVIWKKWERKCSRDLTLLLRFLLPSLTASLFVILLFHHLRHSLNVKRVLQLFFYNSIWFEFLVAIWECWWCIFWWYQYFRLVFTINIRFFNFPVNLLRIRKLV